MRGDYETFKKILAGHMEFKGKEIPVKSIYGALKFVTYKTAISWFWRGVWYGFIIGFLVGLFFNLFLGAIDWGV